MVSPAMLSFRINSREVRSDEEKVRVEYKGNRVAVGYKVRSRETRY